jgi:hypothetical protein
MTEVEAEAMTDGLVAGIETETEIETEAETEIEEEAGQGSLLFLPLITCSPEMKIICRLPSRMYYLIFL